MDKQNPLGDRMEFPYPMLYPRRDDGRKEAECHLDTTGKVRFASLRYDGKEVKRRVPLYFWKMTDEGQEDFMAKTVEYLRREFWLKHGIRV